MSIRSIKKLFSFPFKLIYGGVKVSDGISGLNGKRRDSSGNIFTFFLFTFSKCISDDFSFSIADYNTTDGLVSLDTIKSFFNFRLDDKDIGIFQKFYHSVKLILEFFLIK